MTTRLKPQPKQTTNIIRIYLESEIELLHLGFIGKLVTKSNISLHCFLLSKRLFTVNFIKTTRGYF